MKRNYLLTMVSLVMASQLMAQRPVQEKIAVEAPVKSKSADKGTGTYLIDYVEYDAQYPGNSIQYIGFITDGTYIYTHNNRDTLFGSFAAAYSRYDSMVVTTDYTLFQEFPSSSVISLNVDSIFAYVIHENNSGQNDTLIISMLGLDANRRPNNANVLWDTVIVTNTSLSSNAIILGFAPNILRTGPNWGYAIKVQYNDPSLLDTFALVAPILQNCGVAQFYPAAFYQVNLTGSANSQIIPLTNGQVFWYNDCNFNTQADMPDENIFKHWATWCKVTLAENLGLDEQIEKGVQVVSYPNPAKDIFQIKYELQLGGEVMLTVTDISGKVQMTRNLGTHSTGSYSTQIDATGYTSGVYFYTLEVNQVKITRRFVVTK